MKESAPDYANRADFCDVLKNDTKSFVSAGIPIDRKSPGMGEVLCLGSRGGSQKTEVFREWARAGKRTPIKNAIQILWRASNQSSC
jgi:hypothetical protein